MPSAINYFTRGTHHGRQYGRHSVGEDPHSSGLPSRRLRRCQALPLAQPQHAGWRSVLQAPLLRYLQPPLRADDADIGLQSSLPALLEADRRPEVRKGADGTSRAIRGHPLGAEEVSFRLWRGQDHRSRKACGGASAQARGHLPHGRAHPLSLSQRADRPDLAAGHDLLSGQQCHSS